MRKLFARPERSRRVICYLLALSAVEGLFVIILVGFLFLPEFAQAAQILPACTATGNCGICDFLQTFVNIMRWIIGATGGAALFLMIWHAFGWVIAGGSSEKIQKAKQGVIHTIIAIIIILGAWFLINVVIALIMGMPLGAKISLFSTDQPAWYKYCSQGTTCQGRGNGIPCGDNSKEDRFCYNQECEDEIAPDKCPECLKPVTSACGYWANLDPKFMGNSNPYLGYECVTACADSYESLGTTYCKQTKNQATQFCCLKKPVNP